MRRFKITFKYGYADMSFPSKFGCIRFFIQAGKKEDILSIIEME